MGGLDRLLRPRSVAVIGGGAWGTSVIDQCRRIGYAGDIWAVHPSRDELAGVPAWRSLDDLPGVPDAAFVGVNRRVTLGIVRQLSQMGAGGAVCFASGFREARAEDADGDALQDALLAAAGEMRILGPNCYGMLNYLDGAALWPDQHGGQRVERGVAIVTQSSNIAINLTMQKRGLPLAYVVTAGNQAQTGLAQIGAALLADPRVTALGLHIEGIGDLRGIEALAEEARTLGKPVVALKVGKSDQARAATVSHTASLAGSDAGARALLARLGVGQAGSLAGFLETLKLLHVTGPLRSGNIASMSCSGGEASLMADAAHGTGLRFPPLHKGQAEGLRAALGPMVALANPLDYNTYIWGDEAALTATFTAMMQPAAGEDEGLAMGVVVLDFPRADRCTAPDWELVLNAAERTRDASGVPMALLGTLAETMPEEVAQRLVARGLVPLCGLSEGVEALATAARIGQGAAPAAPLLLPAGNGEGRIMTEAEAKAALSACGLRIPAAARVPSPSAAARAAGRIGFPVVLKGEGIAHKTEAGAVALNLGSALAVEEAARAMPCDSFLVEEMVTGTVAELLVGVLRDPAHGYVLTLAAGGVLTEVLGDSTALLLPVTRNDVLSALDRLKIAPLLDGYRGAPAVDRAAIADAVLAVQAYVADHHPQEIEINPLLCGADGAVAADALIRTGEDND